jgi:hypothetical protein
VRDLIAVIVTWKQPQAADELGMLSHHADPSVRADAVAAVAALRPSGDGTPLIAFAFDADRNVRLQALRLLSGGQYEADWELWRPYLAEELELPAVDRRSLFHALRSTSGDAAAPYFRELLAQHSWKGRKQRDQSSLAAVDVLQMLGSAAAVEALEEGKRSGTTAVRKACAAALEAMASRKART